MSSSSDGLMKVWSIKENEVIAQSYLVLEHF